MNIKGILLDLSGVLYVDNKPIGGAIEAVGKLNEAGFPVRYITNTTRSPRAKTLQRLHNMGFEIQEDELYTAPLAARQYVLDHDLSPYLLIHPDLEPEFRDTQTGEFNAILVGDAGDRFNYDNMNEAFRLLLDGAPLLAMGVNRYFKSGDTFNLDAGPFVNALEYASGTGAMVLGKPSRDFYMQAVESIGCKPDECIMVGDDVESDVIGALNAGINGILVKTGKYRAAAEDLITDKADCVDDINAAVELILENT